MAMLSNQYDPKLGSELLEFATDIDKFDSPDQVLDTLHQITSQACQISVLGALLFPVRWGDLSSIELDKTVFLHKSAPKGWWEEELELGATNRGLGLMLMQLALAPYTMTENMRILEPLGIDRRPFELSLKYGMRDRLTCPVGGRWVVVFWSRDVLSKRLTPEVRALLFMGATFAAIRLQNLIGIQDKRIGNGVSLTPRELSVLRLTSVGKTVKEVAKDLELGDETVRSHIKKAQAKLGVRDRAHAVAQAIRLQLIP